MNAFTLLLLCMLLFPILSTRSSVLSTFHMSNFQIEIDKHTVGNVVKEVCHILRKYFLYRDRFSKSEWEFFEKEFCSRENKQMAAKELVAKMNDKHTKYIDSSIMKMLLESIEGVELSTGVEIGRKLHLEDTAFALKKCFVPSERLRKALRSFMTKQSCNFLHRVQQIDSKAIEDGFKLTTNYLMGTSQLFCLLPMQAQYKLLIGMIGCTHLLKQLLPILYPYEILKCDPQFPHENIRPGDRILSIANKKSSTFMSKRRLNSYLCQGNPDEKISLKLLRKFSNGTLGHVKSEEAFLSRSYATSNRIEYQPLPVSSPQVPYLGYIAIKNFNDETYVEFDCALKKLQGEFQALQQTMKGLVIDLRGNPGGPVTAALDTACLFLPKDTILMQMSGKDAQGCRESYKSKNRNADITTALLILVDQYSASASEMFAAALHDNQRSTTMGMKTVGKHVAQAMISLSDGSGLSCTVREFFSPTGSSMEGGHRPDIIAEHIDLASISWNQSTGWKLDNRYANIFTNLHSLL